MSHWLSDNQLSGRDLAQFSFATSWHQNLLYDILDKALTISYRFNLFEKVFIQHSIFENLKCFKLRFFNSCETVESWIIDSFYFCLNFSYTKYDFSS